MPLISFAPQADALHIWQLKSTVITIRYLLSCQLLPLPNMTVNTISIGCLTHLMSNRWAYGQKTRIIIYSFVRYFLSFIYIYTHTHFHIIGVSNNEVSVFSCNPCDPKRLSVNTEPCRPAVHIFYVQGSTNQKKVSLLLISDRAWREVRLLN